MVSVIRASAGRELSPQAVSAVLIATLVCVLVFTGRRLPSPQPSASALFGIAASFLAPAFIDYPPAGVLDQVGIIFTASVLFYASFLIWSYLWLGRSFGIIPARKPIVTGGPYAFVRHPIYSCYMHIAACYVMQTPTLWNTFLLLVFHLGLLLRAMDEERLLGADQKYTAMTKATRARFFAPAFSMPFLVAASAAYLQAVGVPVP
jgi:protein-S-isoprenylcysteine O-methyltransferase Ste14